MSREIKFRIYELNYNKMTYPKDNQYLISQSGEIYYITDKHSIKINGVLSLYIGINDKNNKMIFEGDILGFKDKRKKDRKLVEYNIIFCEEYGNYIGFENFNSYDKDYEVIGNIYENPELLEEMKL